MGISDLFRKPRHVVAQESSQTAPSRFSRPQGQIAGPFPAEGALQKVLGVRLMEACVDPFGNESSRQDSPLLGKMWWVTIQPSFHAWSELGCVRTEREDRIVGYKVGMVVGGCAAATACVELAALEEPHFTAPELWPGDSDAGMMLDGCAYHATFTQLGSTTTVRFQPVSAKYRQWARDFFSVAQVLQKNTDNPELGEYLEVWGAYLD